MSLKKNSAKLKDFNKAREYRESLGFNSTLTTVGKKYRVSNSEVPVLAIRRAFNRDDAVSGLFATKDNSYIIALDKNNNRTQYIYKDGYVKIPEDDCTIEVSIELYSALQRNYVTHTVRCDYNNTIGRQCLIYMLGKWYYHLGVRRMRLV